MLYEYFTRPLALGGLVLLALVLWWVMARLWWRGHFKSKLEYLKQLRQDKEKEP